MRGFLKRIEGFISKREKLFILCLFLAALIVRLVFICLLSPQNSLTTEDDQQTYDIFAVHILSGWDWLHSPVNHRPPVYPVFLALIYGVCGHNYIAVKVVQAILGSVCVILTYVLGKRLFNAGIGAMAAFWSVFYFQFVFYTGYLLREVLVTFLLLVLVLSLWDFHLKPGLKTLALSSGIFSILAHTDPKFLFYIPFMLLWFAAVKKGWIKGLAFLSILALSMVPWTIRNYLAYNRFVLIDERTLQRRIVIPDMFSYFKAHNDSPLKKVLSPDEKTLRSRQTYSGSFWTNSLFHFKRFWMPCKFSGGYAPHVLINGEKAYLPEWSLRDNTISIACYGILLPLFLLGGIVVFGFNKSAGFLLWLPIAAHTLLHTVQWSRARYRMPVEPYIIILAALGVWWVYNRFAAAEGQAAV